MTEREPDYSRVGRRKERKKSSNILNILIGVVIVLIIVVTATIFIGNDNDEQADDKDSANEAISKDNPSENTDDDNTVEDENLETDDNQSESSDNSESGKLEESTTDKDKDTDKNKDDSEDNSEGAGSITSVPSEDELVAETVVNSAWQPIGTTQTGDHVSQYDGESVDWNEKKQAFAYATGLPQDSMIFWKIKNGGGPQKSIGVVSSRDSKEKYRVYLEWVDGQGWKPVKVDVLTTLDFEH